jgi:GTP-binding protein Era
MNEIVTRCGQVAIIGRPNVGKSTLLNHIIGQKLSITSRKPQTTRHSLLGVKTDQEAQIIFVDTPGIHAKQAVALNRIMHRSALSAINDVDVVLFVLDRAEWTLADQYVAKYLENIRTPIIIVLNKLDVIQHKDHLLAQIELLSKKFPAADFIPISALRKTNIDLLVKRIKEVLPKRPFVFDAEDITNRSERFLVAEIIREKITRQLGAELPYQATVEIEQYTSIDDITHIHAIIFVEREGQKKIIIGNKGQRLKGIGKNARDDIEALLGCRVMLNTWVKVKNGWSDDERTLNSFGYNNEF